MVVYSCNARLTKIHLYSKYNISQILLRVNNKMVNKNNRKFISRNIMKASCKGFFFFFWSKLKISIKE